MKGVHIGSPSTKNLEKDLLSLSAEARIKKILTLYHPKVSLACSFSKEDLLIADMILNINPKARIFAIDTLKLPKETLECAEDFSIHSNCTIEWYKPTTGEVEQLVKEWGEDTYRDSIEARKACCNARKLQPLSRAIEGLDIWITGLRRGQGDTRTTLSVFTPASGNDLAKLNPLFDWTIEEVDAEIKKRNIPINTLYESGYTSIGCDPCTKAVSSGEGIRDGRWWWENSDTKECGLHQ
ncbi:MAG: phosphoadenylyl-sulfate reductase [Euryarchaeota archaeon]|nr:phosphoadenylyl-sulfate reductase [Euryarchaeota archaeon]